MKFITYYVMEWWADLPGGFGWETEETQWVSLDEGTKRLEYTNEKELLQEASGVLAS